MNTNAAPRPKESLTTHGDSTNTVRARNSLVTHTLGNTVAKEREANTAYDQGEKCSSLRYSQFWVKRLRNSNNHHNRELIGNERRYRYGCSDNGDHAVYFIHQRVHQNDVSAPHCYEGVGLNQRSPLPPLPGEEPASTQHEAARKRYRPGVVRQGNLESQRPHQQDTQQHPTERVESPPPPLKRCVLDVGRLGREFEVPRHITSTTKYPNDRQGTYQHSRYNPRTQGRYKAILALIDPSAPFRIIFHTAQAPLSSIHRYFIAQSVA
jgi:hypothetical protein